MSCALVSTGDAAGAGVGCSLGCGTGTARGVRAVSGSGVGDLVGCGFGVFSGKASFFFAGDLLVFDFAPAFFLVALDFDDGDGVFDGLAVGLFRGVLSSLSASAEGDGDLAAFAGDFFCFGVAESSVSDLDGVFVGFEPGLFFFFGEAVGVGEGVLW